MDETRHLSDLREDPEYLGVSREALLRQGKSEGLGISGRRSTRLPMAIPITVSGIDACGGTFKENTFTLSINRHGAEIATNRQLALDGEILVQNLGLGRTVRAKVVRVRGRRSPRSPFEVSVELCEAENIWGVRFPPSDWQESLRAPAGGQRQEEPPAPLPVRGAQATPLSPAPPQNPEGTPAQPARKPASPEVPKAATPSEAVAAAGSPTPPEAAASSGPDTAAKGVGVNSSLQQASPAAAVEPQSPEDKPAKPLDQLAAETHAILREAVNSVEEKVNVVRSLEQQLDEMAGRVKTSQIELELLLSTARLIRKDWHAGFDKAQRQIREAGAAAVQSSSEKTKETWQKELESASSTLLNQAQKHLEEAQASFRSQERAFQQSLQKVQQQIQEGIGNEYAKVRQLFAQQVDGASRTLAEHSAEAAASLNLAAEQASAKVPTVPPQGGPSLKGEAEGSRKQVAEYSTAALQGFQNYLEVMRRGFETELQEAVRQLRDVGAKEALDRFEESMDEQVESSAQRLHRCAEDTLEMLQEEFGGSAMKLVDETHGQLAAVTAQTLASLTRESEAAAEQYRSRLQQMLQEFEDANTRRIESCLQATLETQREALLAELEEKMQGFSEQAVAAVSNKAEQVVKEAADTMYQQVGVVTVLMKDCADQARAQLEPYFRKSAEDFQKQVEGLSRAALEGHRREMEALAENLHCRLQQAARAVCSNGTQAAGTTLA